MIIHDHWSSVLRAFWSEGMSCFFKLCRKSISLPAWEFFGRLPRKSSQVEGLHCQQTWRLRLLRSVCYGRASRSKFAELLQCWVQWLSNGSSEPQKGTWNILNTYCGDLQFLHVPRSLKSQCLNSCSREESENMFISCFLSLIHRLEPSIPRPVAELRTHWSGASCKGLGGAEKVKGWMRVGWSWWSWWSLVWYWCILFLYFMYMRGIFISCNPVGSSAHLWLRILVASCNTMSQGCPKMIQNAQHILLGVALVRNSTSCWMTWSKVSDVGECESSHFTKIVFSSIDMNMGVELLNLSY